jgi:hypothetical protein
LAKPCGGAFLSEEKSPFEDVISYLNLKHGGNVHDRVIVTVTAHEPFSDSSSIMPKNAADLTVTNSWFCSKNAADQWLAYDFQNLRIKPTAYSIRSYHGSQANGRHPKSWAIEVSLDGSRWTEIDRRENNSDLNGASLVNTFSVSESVECRFIRLRQIGLNHHGDYYLVFSSLEIFGHLIESTN